LIQQKLDIGILETNPTQEVLKFQKKHQLDSINQRIKQFSKQDFDTISKNKNI
jgi:hypothetical protein